MNKKAIKIQAGLPTIGTIIDERYELIDLLGRGGFGAVYLARQISMDRNVALKILLTQALNMEELVTRFQREVMAIRNLSHPNTIQIYDFNKSKSGFLYYAMEAVKGPTLKQVIKDDGPLSPMRSKIIAKQILKSLSEAHASRIVHRDLKPANIMLAEMHGEVDYVKVLDFGIAKLLDAEDDEEHLTNAGVLIGTISYMSPEQITSTNIGPTTDIYALGLIGIEMLSGISVFAKSGKWEILNKQISSDPIDVPNFIKNSAIGHVFIKAVSKDPNQRFQNARDMIRALDAVVAPNTQPLIHKGWAGPQVKKGLRSSISHSGPISTANSGLLNTPSQPVPISIDDLEAIPTISESDLVFESGSSQQTPFPQSATGSSDLSSAFSDSAISQSMNQPLGNINAPSGGTLALPRKKQNIGIILAIALVLLLVSGGTILYFSYNSADNDNKALDQKDNKISASKAPKHKGPDLPKKIETAKIDNIRKITLKGPRGALLFDDKSEVLIGTLPITLEVTAPTTFQVRAKGFLPETLALSLSSDEEITMDLKKDPHFEEELKTETETEVKPKITKKKKTEAKTEKDIKLTVKSDTSKTPQEVKKKKKSDWVPIKPSTKKKDTKKKDTKKKDTKKKEKKSTVPVF